jgi:hypothetical protein
LAFALVFSAVGLSEHLTSQAFAQQNNSQPSDNRSGAAATGSQATPAVTEITDRDPDGGLPHDQPADLAVHELVQQPRAAGGALT